VIRHALPAATTDREETMAESVTGQTTVSPFLMFQGTAEAAMTFYTSLFADGRILDIARYGAEGPGAQGSVIKASFVIAGQTIICIDSPITHAFGFTPAFSLFVTCESEAQIRKLASALGDGGTELMPLGNYGFSRLFIWLNDRFGVSWQLTLT
jgi:predicted 3-demethylubiquinone-9 3-methyltransferase (glyoxalase superfamily)